MFCEEDFKEPAKSLQKQSVQLVLHLLYRLLVAESMVELGVTDTGNVGTTAGVTTRALACP